MKGGNPIIIAGTIMIIFGLIAFYSIEAGSDDTSLRIVKNSGTFVGLMGIGVMVAGILLYLINKGSSESHIMEE